jgi:thiol:disulfide interchange protein
MLRHRLGVVAFGGLLCVVVAACSTARVRPGEDVAPAGAEFSVVDIEPGRGSFHDQLMVQLKRAAAIGQTPYIELTADWCEPCQKLHKVLGDTAVMRAFRGTYIMRANVDQWRQVTGKPQMNGIPAFIFVDSAGRWTNRRQLGSPLKTRDIAAAFDAFFHPQS